jgi:hypothetical protein
MGQADSLLDLALEAHGGVERWSRVRTIRAGLRMVGPLWTALGQPTIFANADVTVDTREQRTVFEGFTGPGRRGVYTPGRVAIEDQRGTVIEERLGPRESYPARTPEVRWDPLHALYFGGYAMWNYLTAPYLLTLPGVRTGELAPWRADDGQWRRLRAEFPPKVATHSTDQTFYFDESGLQRRVDYAPYVLGGRPAAHRTEEHHTVSGLVFSAHRYVLPVQGGQPGPTPIIVVDFADISVDFSDRPHALPERRG